MGSVFFVRSKNWRNQLFDDSSIRCLFAVEWPEDDHVFTRVGTFLASGIDCNQAFTIESEARCYSRSQTGRSEDHQRCFTTQAGEREGITHLRSWDQLEERPKVVTRLEVEESNFSVQLSTQQSNALVRWAFLRQGQRLGDFLVGCVIRDVLIRV